MYSYEFIIYILFLGIFFFANGYVLGLKHGFNKAKEIDDKIIEELTMQNRNEKE